ncbi:hypothetical protein C0989_000920, partial [Termitomyces sp. Mn162]
FWKLSMRYASEGASRRFIESIDEYTASVVQEAEDRAQSYIRSIDEYFHVRRKTVGVKPSLALFQFGLNLPDDVLEDPIIERLTNACIDMIILDNVKLSFGFYFYSCAEKETRIYILTTSSKLVEMLVTILSLL